MVAFLFTYVCIMYFSPLIILEEQDAVEWLPSEINQMDISWKWLLLPENQLILLCEGKRIEL